MERYIQQLIEDLDNVACHPPKTPYVEVPPHLDEYPEIAQLAMVPFKPISKWTGIDQEVFPDFDELQGDQWKRVNEAIFRVFESLKILLIDAPPDIPPEWLYDVLTTNWDHPVQYLPSTGMDLELCTGNFMTCPYGDFCSCNEELEIEDEEPPEVLDWDDDCTLPF